MWDPEEFDGITEISLSSDAIWVPDVIISELLEQTNKNMHLWATLQPTICIKIFSSQSVTLFHLYGLRISKRTNITLELLAPLFYMFFPLCLVWMRANPLLSHMCMSTPLGWWRTTNPSRWSQPVTWRFMPFPLTSRTALWPSAAGSIRVKPSCLWELWLVSQC